MLNKYDWIEKYWAFYHIFLVAVWLLEIYLQNLIFFHFQSFDASFPLIFP